MVGRAALVLVFAVAVTLLGPASPTRAAAPALPSSMAALGDSITRAYNTGPSAYQDYPANSWSTGPTASVRSHYARILAQNGAVAGKNFNDAVSGARMADLAAQVNVANSQGVGYVTILMGGNDVCTSSESTMTSVSLFTSQFQAAMNSLAASSPNANVYVLSIPDVYNLWAILKGNGTARFFWGLFGICQSMLARPTSTLPADVQRRADVSQRNQDFNLALQQVCATYAPTPAAGVTGVCRYDGGATFNTKFTAADVSTRDYFHPSLSGQTKLAAVSWSVGFWAP